MVKLNPSLSSGSYVDGYDIAYQDPWGTGGRIGFGLGGEGGRLRHHASRHLDLGADRGPVLTGGNVRHHLILPPSDYQHFDGLIEEVVVYDRVLTSGEIRARAMRCFTIEPIAELDIRPARDGEVRLLTLPGMLLDGTPFEIRGCVTIVRDGEAAVDTAPDGRDGLPVPSDL